MRDFASITVSSSGLHTYINIRPGNYPLKVTTAVHPKMHKGARACIMLLAALICLGFLVFCDVASNSLLFYNCDDVKF